MTIKCYNLKTFKWKQFESSQSSLCQKCVGSSFQFCTLLIFTKPHVGDHTKVLVTISNHCMHSIRKKVHETWKALVTRALGTCNYPQMAKSSLRARSIRFLEMFFPTSTLTLGGNSEDQGQELGGDYLVWLRT